MNFLALAALGSTLAWGLPYGHGGTPRRVRDLTQEFVVRAIIPDEYSNSLIIVATEAAYARILRMVTPCTDPPHYDDDFDYGYDDDDEYGPIELPVGVLPSP